MLRPTHARVPFSGTLLGREVAERMRDAAQIHGAHRDLNRNFSSPAGPTTLESSRRATVPPSHRAGSGRGRGSHHPASQPAPRLGSALVGGWPLKGLQERKQEREAARKKGGVGCCDRCFQARRPDGWGTGVVEGGDASCGEGPMHTRLVARPAVKFLHRIMGKAPPRQSRVPLQLRPVAPGLFGKERDERVP